MEVFGKVSDIVLSREGTSAASGNPYQLQTVVVAGSDNVCFEVFGTMEHLAKNGIIKGAEGKFILKTEVSNYNGKYYQRMRLDNIRNDWKPLGGTTIKVEVKDDEANKQMDAMSQAKTDAVGIEAPAPTPQPTGDLPF